MPQLPAPGRSAGVGPVPFAGFPSRPRSTAIANVFFSDLLPQLTDPVALAVVLYAIHVLSLKRGFPRYLTAADLAANTALAWFITAASTTLDEDNDVRVCIDSGLARAAELRILLPLSVDVDGRRVDLYFLNAPADRRALEAVRAGDVGPGPVADLDAPTGPPPSSVFALYESLIGSLSPLVADELAEAERLYPFEWLVAAFREAAAQTARSWRYVSRILERWAVEGPQDAKTERGPAGGERYFDGKYGRILRQRLRP